jgi:hypothetical protein
MFNFTAAMDALIARYGIRYDIVLISGVLGPFSKPASDVFESPECEDLVPETVWTRHPIPSHIGFLVRLIDVPGFQCGSAKV